jgi:mannose-6-phosphate isomerase-like protein (cupin superfamily)
MGEFVEVEDRPWGCWKIVHEEPVATVKILSVNAGALLSLQVHAKRDEYWVPLSTGLMAYTRNEAGTPSGKLLRAAEVFRVGRGTVHRLVNPTEHDIALVEIIGGQYHEEDIERLHDAYGR